VELEHPMACVRLEMTILPNDDGLYCEQPHKFNVWPESMRFMTVRKKDPRLLETRIILRVHNPVPDLINPVSDTLYEVC
jgi:hypothetical protein